MARARTFFALSQEKKGISPLLSSTVRFELGVAFPPGRLGGVALRRLVLWIVLVVVISLALCCCFLCATIRFLGAILEPGRTSRLKIDMTLDRGNLNPLFSDQGIFRALSVRQGNLSAGALAGAPLSGACGWADLPS